jgi:hypothetical protein
VNIFFFIFYIFILNKLVNVWFFFRFSPRNLNYLIFGWYVK